MKVLGSRRKVVERKTPVGIVRRKNTGEKLVVDIRDGVAADLDDNWLGKCSFGNH